MRSVPKFRCHGVHSGRVSVAVVRVCSTDIVLTDDNAVLDVHVEGAMNLDWIFQIHCQSLQMCRIVMSQPSCAAFVVLFS